MPALLLDDDDSEPQGGASESSDGLGGTARQQPSGATPSSAVSAHAGASAAHPGDSTPAIQTVSDHLPRAPMATPELSQPADAVNRTIVFHDDDNSEPQDDLSDPEDEPAAAVDAQARLSSPVISNLAGVRTPPASGFDCSNDINMKEPSFYEKCASSWNWSTQETMLAVEAVLYVMDNAGDRSAPELNRLANQHYELKVQSAVRDGTWKVGGAPEAKRSINFRTAGDDGKEPKKQVWERYKLVRREIYAGCLPTWRQYGEKFPSGWNLDDVLIRVKQAYYTHYARARKTADEKMPDGWTDAIFQCFVKYGPPAGKEALEVFGAKPPNRNDPKDGKPGSSTTSRQDVREKMKLDYGSKLEHGDINPASVQAWMDVERLHNNTKVREQEHKERCFREEERRRKVDEWKNALEMIEKMPGTMKPPLEYITLCWTEYMKALQASNKTVRTPPMSPANVKRVRTDDDQASSPSSSPSLRPTVTVDIQDD